MDFGSLREVLEDLKGIIKRGKMSGNVEILMFHDVGETKEFGPQKYSVSESHFERVIENYAESHEFVRLEEVSKWLKGKGDLPDNAVAITFDDGYLSTKKKALPILEEKNIPATVYVPSGHLDINYSFDFKLVSLLTTNDCIEFGYEGKEYYFNIESFEDRVKTYEQLRGLMKNLSVKERETLLSNLGAQTADSGSLMDVEDLKELDDHHLISIGAHSTDHRDLAEIEKSKARKSIINSKKELEEILDHEVSSFSFPFGSRNNKLVEFVRSAGFSNSVVTDGRCVSERNWGNVYEIPRVDGKYK
jgi:peptidoglycan/xylan/chitin deacetylase (PgdA/CDA1 family)